MQAKLLTKFIIKVFLFLPICYWVWYYSASHTIRVVAYLAELLLKTSYPKLISSIEQIGYHLDIVVNVTIPAGEVPKGMVAELPIPINPLIYNYGLPLCTALILSSPGSPLKASYNIFLSILLLLPIQLWGVCFEFMKVLFLQTPRHLIANIAIQPWQMSIIAIGYQMGALVLPAVTPIIIWLFLYRDFMIQLSPGLHKVDT